MIGLSRAIIQNMNPSRHRQSSEFFRLIYLFCCYYTYYETSRQAGSIYTEIQQAL